MSVSRAELCAAHELPLVEDDEDDKVTEYMGGCGPAGGAACRADESFFPRVCV